MDEPDPKVLARARDGDRDAAGEIIRLAQPHVWRFVHSLTHDRELATDLTQETLLKMVRSIDRFGGRSRFRTWVFAIARNVVRDHHRATSRRPRLVALDDHAADLAEPTTPGYGDDLAAALQALPSHLREVFTLVEVLGLRYREVAELLDLAEGTVKSRMFHARHQLIAWIEETEDLADG